MYLLHHKTYGIYANVFILEVTVATPTQLVSRPDGGSAPREDLDSPEC